MNESMSRRIVPSDLATVLGDNEMQDGILAATSIGCIAAILFVVSSLLSIFGIFPMEVYRWGVVGLIFLAALVTGGIICLAWVRAQGHRKSVADWAKAENKLKDSTPPAQTPLPALPAIETPIAYNHYSRGGQTIPRELVNGFDPRDLEWLARYLANGGIFTEAVMENITLPYALEPMGKATEGTHYHRLMRLCTETGIIVGRAAKKSGTLAITEYPEILRRLKLP